MSIDPIKRNNVSVSGNLAAGQSIVFVHGFGTDQHAWEAVAKAFSRDFRIVLLDNVGAGASAPEAFVQHRYLNLQQYAKDLIEVCQALEIEQAIVVGHSVGGMIALLAALEAPVLFAKLVLLGSSPRYLDEAGYQGGFSKADIANVYDSVVADYSAWVDSIAPLAMMNADRPQLTRHFSDSLKAIPKDRALTILCAILQSDHRQSLHQLEIPTLIVQTASDYAVPLAIGEYLQQHIPNSHLAVIDAEGHLPHVSVPEKVLAAMMPFIYPEPSAP